MTFKIFNDFIHNCNNFSPGYFIFLELDICVFRKIRFDFNLYIITRSFDGLYLKKKMQDFKLIKSTTKIKYIQLH